MRCVPCGQQFVDADLGSTLTAIVGERTSGARCRSPSAGHRLASGSDATIRIVADAHHSFDRLEEPHTIAEASVAPGAPTVMLDDDGAMILPTVGVPDPTITDRDAFVAAISGGHGRLGAAIGGVGQQPALFTADMLAFHRSWSANLNLLSARSGCFDGEIRQDAGSARPFERHQALEHDILPLKPSVVGCACEHRVLTAHLVGERGDLEGAAHRCTMSRYGMPGFTITMSAPLVDQRHLSECFIAIAGFI